MILLHGGVGVLPFIFLGVVGLGIVALVAYVVFPFFKNSSKNPGSTDDKKADRTVEKSSV